MGRRGFGKIGLLTRSDQRLEQAACVKLVAGAFGAARVREARAGTVILGRGRGAGLGASGGPPARGVAGKFTHFRAA